MVLVLGDCSGRLRGRRDGVLGGRTGDAQIGLASSVHDDGGAGAQADGGCWARVEGATRTTRRLSELAGVQGRYQRWCSWLGRQNRLVVATAGVTGERAVGGCARAVQGGTGRHRYAGC